MIDLDRYEDIGLSQIDRDIVVKVASEFRDLPVETVTDKIEVAPSGDRHDYYSWAPYMWFEEGRTVRRDGKINPEVYKYDKSKLVKFAHAVKFLGQAYQLTEDVSFAAKAREWICAWMVDPVTRMNPHMKYAQAAPWSGSLSAGGVIEGRRLIWVSRVARELGKHNQLSSKELETVRDWLVIFLEWLLVSPQGISERKAPNNHGTWYDALVVSLANYLDNKRLSDEVLVGFPGRIAFQMDFDGSFPLEDERADPSHYVRFNLHAMLIVMEVGFCGFS